MNGSWGDMTVSASKSRRHTSDRALTDATVKPPRSQWDQAHRDLVASNGWRDDWTREVIIKDISGRAFDDGKAHEEYLRRAYIVLLDFLARLTNLQVLRSVISHSRTACLPSLSFSAQTSVSRARVMFRIMMLKTSPDGFPTHPCRIRSCVFSPRSLH